MLDRMFQFLFTSVQAKSAIIARSARFFGLGLALLGAWCAYYSSSYKVRTHSIYEELHHLKAEQSLPPSDIPAPNANSGLAEGQIFTVEDFYDQLEKAKSEAQAFRKSYATTSGPNQSSEQQGASYGEEYYKAAAMLTALNRRAEERDTVVLWARITHEDIKNARKYHPVSGPVRFDSLTNLQALAKPPRGAESDPTSNYYRSNTALLGAVFLLHLFYLMIVVMEYIFKQSVEELRYSSLLFPSILTIVYCLSAVETFSAQALPIRIVDTNAAGSYLTLATFFSSKSLSVIFFLMTYLIGLILDIQDYREKENSKTLKSLIEIMIMGGIDLFAVLSLGIALIDASFFDSEILLWSYMGVFGVKDGVILASLGGYMFTNLIVFKVLRHQFQYPYGGFLDAIRHPSDRSVRKSLGLDELAEFQEWRKHLVAPVRILDFGCADGRRCIQLIDALDIQEAGFTMIGLEKDSRWSDLFDRKWKSWRRRRRAENTSAQFLARGDPIESEFDIIIGSHLDEGEEALEEFIRVIHMHAGPNAWVFVRGVAPSSIFASLSNQVSIDGIFVEQFHLWNQERLREIVERTRLRNVLQNVVKLLPNGLRRAIVEGQFQSVGLPLGIIKQRVAITRASRINIAQAIASKFGARIGDSVLKMFDWQFQLDQERNRVHEINCNDLVYLFRRSVPGQLRTVTGIGMTLRQWPAD